MPLKYFFLNTRFLLSAFQLFIGFSYKKNSLRQAVRPLNSKLQLRFGVRVIITSVP